MPAKSSEETAVVATYPTRHDAEIAKDFLEDNGIAAFVIADDVHVPLQLTQGARLVVMQSDAQRAYEALADVGMTADSMTSGQEDVNDEEENGEQPPPPPSPGQP